MTEETISKLIIALVGPVSAFIAAYLQRKFMNDELAGKEFIEHLVVFQINL